MHEAEASKLVDPYYWMKDMTEEEKRMFVRDEDDYYELLLIKYDLLHKQLIREQEFYEPVSKVLPLRIGDYIYYRRFDNPADALTLYRFPLEEL